MSFFFFSTSAFNEQHLDQTILRGRVGRVSVLKIKSRRIDKRPTDRAVALIYWR